MTNTPDRAHFDITQTARGWGAAFTSLDAKCLPAFFYQGHSKVERPEGSAPEAAPKCMRPVAEPMRVTLLLWPFGGKGRAS